MLVVTGQGANVRGAVRTAAGHWLDTAGRTSLAGGCRRRGWSWDRFTGTAAHPSQRPGELVALNHRLGQGIEREGEA